jgi:hypothetical protein
VRAGSEDNVAVRGKLATLLRHFSCIAVDGTTAKGLRWGMGGCANHPQRIACATHEAGGQSGIGQPATSATKVLLAERSRSMNCLFRPMNWLFCPVCGESYSDSTCELVPVRWTFDRLCPGCHCQLQVAGWVYLAIGFPIGFLLLLVLSQFAEWLGYLVLATSCALAAMRSIRQCWTRWRWHRQHRPPAEVAARHAGAGCARGPGVG